MVTFLSIIAAFFRAIFIGKQALILENLALRQQLGVYLRKTKRPKLRTSDRFFWVFLSQIWEGWKSSLVIVKPDTVIGWHRQGFRLYWRWRSRTKKIGRPRIPRKHIEFIKRISRENPTWGEDKIFEELKIKFGVERSTSAIRRYMVNPRNPKRGQTWRRFIDNHKGQIFACDFLTQYTIFFNVVYIFIIMELGSRQIVHVNVSESPGLDWLKQQSREISPYGQGPRFMIHDNDGVFGQFVSRKKDHNGKSYRCAFDMWLEKTMGIKGIPIPYGAPNANARLERFNLTLRVEALNHFIFFCERHIYKVCKEYIIYYNHGHPSQALYAIPDPYPELKELPPKEARIVALPILGGIYHDYRLVA
jgi:putative transposase